MQKNFPINRYKAEAPVMATFFIFCIFVSLYLYPRVLWYSFAIFPLMFLIYIGLRKIEFGFFKRKSFLYVDEDGIRYCFHLYQKPVFIAWDILESANHQLYETNLKIKSSGEIISIQKGYFNDEQDFENFKALLDSRTKIDYK